MVCCDRLNFMDCGCIALQDLGQATSLGNDRLNITMFAPLNSAFNAPLPAVLFPDLIFVALFQSRPQPSKLPFHAFYYSVGIQVGTCTAM